MKPVVDRLKRRYEGKVEFRRLDVNDRSNAKLADSLGVQYVPTFVFVNADGTRADQIVGETAERDLARRLDALR